MSSSPPPPVLPANLYRTVIGIPEEGTLNFRVFLWHGHEYSQTKYFLIVLRLTSGDANGSVTNHKSIQNTKDVARLGLLYKQGICCAKAQRNGTLDDHSNNPALPLDTDVVLAAYKVGPPVSVGKTTEPLFACAVHEFTIHAPADSKLHIRTVISTSATATGDESGPMLEPFNPEHLHVRGSWPYSAINVIAGNPVDLATITSPVRFEIGASSGPDTAMFAPRPGDTGATANVGLYGVNVHYEIPITDSTPNQHFLLDGYFRGRNVGAKYFGAVVAPVYAGIPRIASTGDVDNAVEMFTHTEVGGDVFPIIFVENATGGACGTPVDFTLSWRPI
jgi:hypothetical protein